MEILLVRHGRPTLPPRRPITGREIGQWVTQYEHAGIDGACLPPERVARLVASAGCLVTSNLRRSIESAALLAPASEVHIDPDLREAVLPRSIGVPVRMPPDVWVVLARLAWWFDWCPSDENVEATRGRAGRSADRLCRLVREHQSVAVVGHGVFNWFVGQQLVERGWRRSRSLRTGYWSAKLFRPRQLHACSRASVHGCDRTLRRHWMST